MYFNALKSCCKFRCLWVYHILRRCRCEKTKASALSRRNIGPSERLLLQPTLIGGRKCRQLKGSAAQTVRAMWFLRVRAYSGAQTMHFIGHWGFQGITALLESPIPRGFEQLKAFKVRRITYLAGTRACRSKKLHETCILLVGIKKAVRITSFTRFW